ncbi:MAG: OsmC family protein [Anaerolineae bacterium]|nr:OsmC family protein [Anaerolineae bacterium]
MAALDSYLERKTTAMAARHADYTASPEKSVVKLTASSHVAGITGARPTRVGNFSILTDSGPGLAGHALGPTAPELMLGALASCLVHTYLIQAVLLNIPLDNVEVEISASLDYAPVIGLPSEQPPQLRDVTYRATVTSPATPDQIARMHEAVDISCPVLNTLRNPVGVKRLKTE